MENGERVVGAAERGACWVEVGGGGLRSHHHDVLRQDLVRAPSAVGELRLHRSLHHLELRLGEPPTHGAVRRRRSLRVEGGETRHVGAADYA